MAYPSFVSAVAGGGAVSLADGYAEVLTQTVGAEVALMEPPRYTAFQAGCTHLHPPPPAEPEAPSVSTASPVLLCLGLQHPDAWEAQRTAAGRLPMPRAVGALPRTPCPASLGT